MGKTNIWNKTAHQPFKKEGEVSILGYFFSYFNKLPINILILCFIFCRSKKEPEADLFAIISERQSKRKNQVTSFLSSLESKYGGSNASSEPTEEEFEAIQKKMESRRKGSKKSNQK